MRRSAHVAAELEEFEKLCRKQRLPVTIQRRTVWEVLAGREDHPTADRIFDDVRARIPGISRATVYRILETLVKIGVTRKVSHPRASARFETKMQRHHHLVCLQCGKMVDLEDSSLGQCGSCHPAPYYTDNSMHNLRAERFYQPRLINGRMASADGPIKTFPLRGIKDSPTYLHDGRLLTLEDTGEFFNVVLGSGLSSQEKADLTAFMRVL